jgi:hypothetical protein
MEEKRNRGERNVSVFLIEMEMDCHAERNGDGLPRRKKWRWTATQKEMAMDCHAERNGDGLPRRMVSSS